MSEKLLVTHIQKQIRVLWWAYTNFSIAQYAPTGTECTSALRVWLRRFCPLSCSWCDIEHCPPRHYSLVSNVSPTIKLSWTVFTPTPGLCLCHSASLTFHDKIQVTWFHAGDTWSDWQIEWLTESHWHHWCRGSLMFAPITPEGVRSDYV